LSSPPIDSNPCFFLVARGDYIRRFEEAAGRIPDMFDGHKRAARKAKGKMQALLRFLPKFDTFMGTSIVPETII